MLIHRRIFQNIHSNRLRRYQLVSLFQCEADSRNRCTKSCPHVDRLKRDIVTHKRDIQPLDVAYIKQIQNSKRSSLNRPLPFEAIPCADQPTSNRFSQWWAIAHQFRQLLTGRWDSRFHEEIDECHHKYGPIFRQSRGPIQAVFIQSPEMLRDVFTYEGKYPKNLLPEAWTMYNQIHNCQRGLFFMEDAEWLETRKQLAPLMLRNEQRFSTAIESATDDSMENWKKIAVNRDQFTELPHALTSLYGWSIRVLMGIMFGNTAPAICMELRTKIDHFAQIVQNVFEDSVPLAHISPRVARKFKLPIWTKFESNVTDTLTIASEIIDHGLQRSQCDGLLSEMKALGMSDDMIKRIFIDLIIAAGDTTAFTTQWALYLLSENEACQETLRQEVMTTDAPDTPLVRGTVREAMRLYPVATFIGRFVGKDAILSNYHVPQHTLVLISMYSAGRDETSFPHASQFDASRWIRDPVTSSLKLVNRAQSSIPYAMGARNCIGQRIANAQMHIILSKLLRTFKVQLLNANEIDIVMRLIIAPSKSMRFAVKRID